MYVIYYKYLQSMLLFCWFIFRISAGLDFDDLSACLLFLTEHIC